MKQFVTTLDKQYAAFMWLQYFLPNLSATTIKANVLVASQIQSSPRNSPKSSIRPRKQPWTALSQWSGASRSIIRPKTMLRPWWRTTAKWASAGPYPWLSSWLFQRENIGLLRGARRALPPEYIRLRNAACKDLITNTWWQSIFCGWYVKVIYNIIVNREKTIDL